MASVPVVDFSAYGLERDYPDQERFQRLIDDVYNAFTTIGFVYLKNFGIPDKKIERVFEVSRQFFQLEQEVKMKCELPKENIHGYIFMGRESASQTEDIMRRPHTDLREGFNFVPSAQKLTWPEGFPEFKESFVDLLETGKNLLHRVLEVMARGLKCEDPMLFVKCHQKIGTSESSTSVRSNYYPPTAGIDVKEDQVRCGEHSDYGSVTLLFQKDQAGLEVKNRKSEWISAPPIEGTVVVNLGDTMQRWTADKFLASKHRVMNPIIERDKQAVRQTIAYFGIPDNGTMIECVDGSNKYPPIEISEYIHEQYNKIQPY